MEFITTPTLKMKIKIRNSKSKKKIIRKIVVNRKSVCASLIDDSRVARMTSLGDMMSLRRHYNNCLVLLVQKRHLDVKSTFDVILATRLIDDNGEEPK